MQRNVDEVEESEVRGKQSQEPAPAGCNNK